MSSGLELADLRRGKSEAWRRVHERVHHAAASFRPDLGEEWEDAIQEAEIKLLRALQEKRFADQAHLQAFIWRVTRNVCVDQLRRRRVRSAEPMEAITEPPAPRKSSPLTAAERDEQRAQIALMLRLLPERCRRLLLLLRQGKSYSDLAWQMGESPGALRVRAHRCRRRARTRWARMTSPIVGAGWRVFRRHGYVETPLSWIAEEAGTTEAEVETLFQNKENLFWAIVNRVVTGVDGVSLEETGFLGALRSESDPARRVQLAAQWSAGYRARGLGEIEEMVEQAGRTTPRCETLVRHMHAMRRVAGQAVVGLITEGLRLHEGITTDSLLAGVWTFENRVTYWRLTGEGFSREEYGEWLARALGQLLLP